MAYPTVNAPYGLVPINLIGGQVFAGATRQLPIASGYGTAIYYGDVVKFNTTDGTIEKEAGTATVSAKGVVGVFLGVTYTNPSTGQKLFTQSYPSGGVVASDILAYVADDPDQLFKVAVTGGATSSTITPIGADILGSNLGISQPAANTTISGNSNIGAYNAADSTVQTLPLRVVGLVPETTDANGDYSEVIVKWNAPYPTITIDFNAETASVTVAGGHSYLNPNGQFNV